MSFDAALTTDLDKARFYVGDTTNDPDTELFDDEVYEAVLDLYPTSLPTAVAVLAEALAAKYAQRPSSVGLPSGLSASWSERVKFWLGLAARIRSTGSLTGISAAFSVTPTRSDGYTEAAQA